MNMDWENPRKGQTAFCTACHKDKVLTGKFRTVVRRPDKGPETKVPIAEARMGCGHWKVVRIAA